MKTVRFSAFLFLILAFTGCQSQRTTKTGQPEKKAFESPENAIIGPAGIPVFMDYDLAKKYADEHDKPLLVNYSAYAEVQCRWMEDQVWTTPEINTLLGEDVVVVMLYTDDKKPLPIEKQFVSDMIKVENAGDYFRWQMITKYKTLTLPLYVILDQNEQQLGPFINYVRPEEAPKFASWLQNGISKYKGK